MAAPHSPHPLAGAVSRNADDAGPDPWLPAWLERDDRGRLQADGASLQDLAQRFGTPLFVYSQSEIERTWDGFARALAGRPARICYALKANPRLALVDLFRRLGAGFDIVSDGELDCVLAVGGDPALVLYSGVGKSAQSIERALQVGVGCFNVESVSELHRISDIARRLGRVAPISLRVNPDVDAATHPYISTGLKDNKFGIAHEHAIEVYRLAATLPSLRIVGIDCHIGSQITDIAPFLASLDRLIALVDQLSAEGIRLQHLDLGGGLGIRYQHEEPPPPEALMNALFARLDAWPGSRGLELRFEFGRSLVGNAGLLLTRIEYLKTQGDRHFAIVDAAMTELMRPTLYGAWHGIVAVDPPLAAQADGPGQPDSAARLWDVVGPVCESGDWLGKDRHFQGLSEGALLAVLSTGAYASAMGSTYNSRPRAAEVLLVPAAAGESTAAPTTSPRGAVQATVVRRREPPAALLELEQWPGQEPLLR